MTPDSPSKSYTYHYNKRSINNKDQLIIVQILLKVLYSGYPHMQYTV
jgi:hypothetical protein